MKATKCVKALTCAISVFIAFLVAAPAQAAVELYDGKLVLNGWLKNTTYIRTSMYDREMHGPGSNHESPIDFCLNSFVLEALYTVKQDDELTIRLFGGVKFWYNLAYQYDDDLRDSIQHEQRKEAIMPRMWEDYISEAYIDFIRGPLQVRLGKQIVIWGQLDVNRVADVVNPLDLRRGVPGVDNWEEIKQGLWMMRAFYQTQIPGNILIEAIFNPGDYKGLLLPYQSTHWGPEYFKNAQFQPGREDGLFSYLHRKWISDMPGFNLGDNYEWGFRLRGFFWNIDWTLLFWDARDDGPVADADEVTPFTMQYIFAGIDAASSNSAVRQGDYTRKRVWKFKRYQTLGGTAQTFVDWLYNSVWRLEWFWEINRPLNLGTGGSSQSVYDETRTDIFGFALQGNWKLYIPWLTKNIGTGKQMDVSVTYFWEKVFDHERDMVLNDRFHRPGDSVADEIVLFVQQHTFNSTFVFTFIGNYWFRAGKWMAVPVVTYTFPERVLNGGLRADFGAKVYGGAKHGLNNPSGLSHTMDHKDALILRLRYEF